jgi:hypothetical protein
MTTKRPARTHPILDQHQLAAVRGGEWTCTTAFGKTVSWGTFEGVTTDFETVRTGSTSGDGDRQAGDTATGA